MEKWRNLEPKQVMTKMTQIMDTYKQNVPEHLYIEIMNATKVMYDAFDDDEDMESIAEEASRDPIKMQYEITARMALIERAKMQMNEFKPIKRMTHTLKELAIRSYCRHIGVRIPVHSWECLVYYGYRPNINVSEKQMYTLFKSHHNEKMKHYEKMYNVEMEALNKMLLLIHKQ
jgi:hypothetical protein